MTPRREDLIDQIFPAGGHCIASSLFPDDFLDDRLAILKSRSFDAHTPGDLWRNHNICTRATKPLLKLQNLGLSMNLNRAWLKGLKRAQIVNKQRNLAMPSS